MMDYDQKKILKKYGFSDLLLNQRVLAVFGLAVLTLITIPLIRNYNQKRMISKEIMEMESEIARVENKNNDLRKLIEYFESDQFVEEQARLNFGLRKGGEQVAVLKDSAGQEGGEKEASSPKGQIFDIPGLERQLPPKIVSNPSRWWNYYFHK